MLFRSYIGTYLPSGERLHVVEVNVQRRRYARSLCSVAPNTMVKPVTKHHLVESNVTWNGYIYICSGPWKSKKWPPIRLPHSNSVSSRRGCFTKRHVIYQAIAVLRHSVGLPGRFVTVWKIEPDTHTTTVTAQAWRGLII